MLLSSPKYFISIEIEISAIVIDSKFVVGSGEQDKSIKIAMIAIQNLIWNVSTILYKPGEKK